MTFYAPRNIGPADQVLFDADGNAVGIQAAGSSSPPVLGFNPKKHAAIDSLVSGDGIVTPSGLRSTGLSALQGALIGHRGMAGQSNESTTWRAGPFPENSLAGYKAAIAAGVTMFETDVRIDADGTAWIFHDSTVAAPGKALITDAASNVDIRTLTTAQVRALNVYHSTASGAPGWLNERILTLDEFVEEFGARAMFIWEAKATLAADGQETARTIANRLRAHNIPRDWAFISAFDSTVFGAQTAYPGIRYLTTAAGYSQANMQANIAAGAVALSADTGWDLAQVSLAHSLGLLVGLGAPFASRRSDWAAFRAIGGDFALSDEPLYASGASPTVLSAPFSQGKWPHGAISSLRSQGGRGQLSLSGKWHNTYLSANGSRSTLCGWFGSVSGDWQLDFTLRWDTYATGATNAGPWVTFGTSTDQSEDTTATGTNGETGLPNRFGRGGGTVKLRRNQDYSIFKRAADGSSETLVANTGLSTALAGSGTSVTDNTDQDANKGTGTPYQMRITRVGNTVSVFNITQDGAVTPKITATDPMLGQAGYFHFCRTNATWTIEGLTLTAL